MLVSPSVGTGVVGMAMGRDEEDSDEPVGEVVSRSIGCFVVGNVSFGASVIIVVGVAVCKSPGVTVGNSVGRAFGAIVGGPVFDETGVDVGEGLEKYVGEMVGDSSTQTKTCASSALNDHSG